MSRAAEARLLYALLAAAEEEERLLGSGAQEQWLALKLRFHWTRADRVHGALLALFEDLERREIFTGTWIASRWQQAKSQRGLDPAFAPTRRGVTHK